jgi:hypothetical protein
MFDESLKEKWKEDQLLRLLFGSLADRCRTPSVSVSVMRKFRRLGQPGAQNPESNSMEAK